MRRYRPRHLLLAYGLAALAGFVDAVGFLKLGGFFISFMSGNSTRMAVGTADLMPSGLFAGQLIAAFVGGVVTGASIGRIAGRWCRQAVLGAVMLLLALAASVAEQGHAVLAPLLMALAMGAANAVFQRDGEVSIGVTYMTGTLVKFGQHLAAALVGGPRFAWAPYLLLWLALVAGAIAGAIGFRALDLGALWIAVTIAALLLGGAIAIGPADEA